MVILILSFLVLGWVMFQYFKEIKVKPQALTKINLKPLVVDNKIFNGSELCPFCGKKFNEGETK